MGVAQLISQTQAKSWEYEALAKQPQYDPPQARQLHERGVQAGASAQSALEAGDPRKAYELAQAVEPFAGPGRPSLGSNSGRSGFGASSPGRKK